MLGACGFNPACHVQGWLTGFADMFLSLFPFGFTGLVFFVGLIAGERLGKWGVMAVILGWIAYRFGKVAVPDFDGGNVSGNDAKPPIHRTGRGKPRVILRTAKRSGGRRPPPMPPTSLVE